LMLKVTHQCIWCPLCRYSTDRFQPLRQQWLLRVVKKKENHLARLKRVVKE
jgi:hypothetical protein